MLRSLYGRILALVLALLAALQLAGFLFVSQAILAYAKRNLDEELSVAAKVLSRQLDQNGQRLAQAARVLAADFGFREAVATADRVTIQSALDNSAARIQADLVALTDPDGKVLATSSNAELAEVARAIERSAASTESTVELRVIAGTPYQIVSVPVLAPQLIATVRLGFRLGDALAGDLRQVTNTHVSFVTRPAGQPASVAATSLGAGLRRALPQAPLPTAAERVVTIRLAGEDFESLVLPLTRESGVGLEALLQRSLAEAMAPFKQMQYGLLALSLVGLAIATAAAIVTARRIARPVAELAAAARRMEAGDYAAEVEVRDKGEIGGLASAFNHMQHSIAERERRISEMAYWDALTGLPNRLQLHESLARMLEDPKTKSGSMAVLWINIDRFGSINEILGYLAGDEVLRAAAARLREFAGNERGMAARHGGDEFVLLLPGADARRATTLVERIVREFELPIRVDETDIDVGVTGGVSLAPEHGSESTTLLRRAELALNRAKESHVRWRMFEPGFDKGGAERLTLLYELRRAVQGNELRLAYQPKVEIGQRHDVVAVEALIRWQHPSRGWVMPAQFIPFAEQTGFITRLTRWGIGAACQQSHAWEGAGIRTRIYVNASAYDLALPNFADFVREELDRAAVDPSRLGIEVTESAFMSDPRGVMTTLERLNETGVDIAIDDFGTGYSSLAYLRQLPVQELKIDRSFVKDMVHNRGDEAIVRSTIDLGHNLGLSLTAEGVEDKATCDLLQRLGCDFVQGFLFSKPLLAGDFETWLAAFTSRQVASAAGD